MTETPTRRLSLLTGILAAVALVAAGLPGYVATSWAYAVEKGRIGADRDELARVEEVANAFRLVAKVTMPGVVQINVAPSPKDIDEERKLQREAADLRFEIERMRRDQESDVDAMREKARELAELDERLAELKNRTATGNGSGLIYDDQGHILTNHHVVGGRERIRIRLNDGREYAAKLVGDDPKSDLAMVRIEARDIHPLPFSDSDKLEVGDWVLAVGAPFGLSQSVTHGIVSAKGRTDVALGRNILYRDFIQTDAAINPGNSGGPLVNIRGEVVGVNTAIATEDGFNAGIGFVIPANSARKVAEQLRASGKVTRGWLGVSLREISGKDADALGLKGPGVMLNVLYEGAAAHKAGLQCEDVILAVNEHPLATIAQLRDLIADVAPGSAATLSIQRDGEKRDVQVQTDSQPDDIDTFSRGAKSIRGRKIESLPLVLRTLRPGWFSLEDESRWARAAQQVYGDQNGLLVLDKVGNAADRYAFEPGQLIYAVNGKSVHTVVDLERALKAASGKSVMIEMIEQNGEKKKIEYSE